MISKYALHNLAQDTCEAYGLIVSWAVLVAFLENGSYIGQLPINWYCAFIEGFVEDEAEWNGNLLLEFNKDFGGDPVRTRS